MLTNKKYNLDYMLFAIIALLVTTITIHTFIIDNNQNEIKKLNNKIKEIEKYNVFYNIDSTSNK